MKSFWIISCVTLALLWSVRADEDVKDEDVLVLKNDNFDSTIGSNELMLVEFYAPWCGHCKRLAPEYAQAATILKNNDPPIPLAKVDATVEAGLASRFKVNGYPKLFIFRNGREYDYNGPREAAGIVEYMKKQVGPAAKPLTTGDDIQKFTTLNQERDYAVVGYFDPANLKSSQLYSSFLLIANKMREDFYFGIVSDVNLAKSQGVDGEALIAYKNYDDKKTVYSGPSRKQNVEDWVNANSIPLVGEFTNDRATRYMKKGLPIAKFYMKIDWSPANVKHTTYYVNRLQEVAAEYRNQVLFTIANSSSFLRALEELGMKGKENVLVIEQGRQKYRFEQPFKVANIKQFVSDFVNGKLAPYIKSEPIPSNDGPVTVVVGNTFEKIVNDPEKDVLIEFYAPWCGHCKALEPIYNKLGKKFKGVDSVVIAKMDATANDYSNEYEVSGFPTIYFKPAKSKKPIKYEGEREVDDFVQFIKKNAKIPFSFKKKAKDEN